MPLDSRSRITRWSSNRNNSVLNRDFTIEEIDAIIRSGELSAIRELSRYYYRTNESSVTRLRANFIKTVESLVDEKMLLEFATENAAECTQKKCRDLLIQNLNH